jgi:hypothetical protein
MFTCVPRFCSHSVITGPTYSCGMRIVARMIGSRISSTCDRSGSFDGLSISITSPSRLATW